MKRFSVVICILGMLLAASSAAYGEDAFVFFTNLSGEQEVAGDPPIAPQSGVTDPVTRGRARIRFNRILTRARFVLIVRNGLQITQAHLHCAPAGVNGPVVAFLFGPVDGVDVNGLLAEGDLTNASIVPDVDFASNPACGMAVNNIASLRAAAQAGRIYVNVHSVAHPPGVTRGQLVPLNGDSDDGGDDS